MNFYKLENFIKEADVEPSIIGSHLSKSIHLPVIKFYKNDKFFILRYNFCDINLYIQSEKNQINLPMSVLFKDILNEVNWEYYLNEIKRCGEFLWYEYTDEEMNNPDYFLNDSLFKKSIGEQIRWFNRFKSPEWFEKDWSSAKLLYEGEFNYNTKMYYSPKCFMQGIPYKDSPYYPNCFSFTICLKNFNQVKEIIKRLK